MSALLERAERALADDDLAAARASYRAVLRVSPDHPIASLAIAEIERELALRFAPGTWLTLTVGLRQLVLNGTEPRDALVLSRLAPGSTTVERLGEACGMNEGDLHELLQRCAMEGLVRVDPPRG